MSDFKLNSNNDIAIENFNFVIITEEENIAQRVLINLRVFLGEWFLDTTRGVPYYQSILIKNPDSSLVEAELRAVILSTNGIAKLKSFSMEFNAALRKLSVNFVAQTDEGLEIALEEVI